MKRKSSFTVAFLGLIAVLLGHASPVVAQDAVLAIEGECPGQVRIAWSEAIPDRHCALLYGRRRGKTIIPALFHCSGTVVGVQGGFREIHRFRTGANGAGSLTGQANAEFCGGVLQLIVHDDPRCQLSNVVDIPQ